MTRPSLLAALLLSLALAGCLGGQDGDNPPPAGSPPAGNARPGHREDVKEIVVPAGKSLEYKLFMQEGAEMAFSWSASRALYYDFHGDREGDTSGAFTRHESGTAALDQGDFTAPFQGRHGWYWENRNREDVTVTLTTKGDYIVVGFVG